MNNGIAQIIEIKVLGSNSLSGAYWTQTQGKYADKVKFKVKTILPDLDIVREIEQFKQTFPGVEFEVTM